MKKILFAITSLTIGGAERVLVDLVNRLCKNYEITILTLYPNGELEKSLDKKIKVQSIYDKSFSEYSPLKRKKISVDFKIRRKEIYKKFIEKNDYDVEIAFLEGPVTRLLSVKNPKTHKIAWIHNDISKVFGNTFKAKIEKYVDKRHYENYEKLVFVSNENLIDFQKTYPDLEKEKQIIIPNYFDEQRILDLSEEKENLPYEKGQVNFLCICRLVKQKGLDRLIRVHIRLIKKIPHKIFVIGQGPEEKNLRQLINKNNIQDSFKLLGKKENPYPYLKKADAFCFLSYFEGYGMVLEEAKLLNKYIIITNTAAKEAVKGYEKCTILENNEESIEKGLEKILLNPDILNNSKTYEIKQQNEEILEKVIQLLKM